MGPSDSGRQAKSATALLNAAVAGLAGPSVPTGFPSVDNLLGGGLRRGDLVVLGGDAGSGKSALALAIALRTCATGYRVLYCTGEMSAPRVAERAVAMEARVSIDQLRREGGAQRVREALARLEQHLPHIHTVSQGKLAAVAGVVRKTRPALTVLDPLTHFTQQAGSAGVQFGVLDVLRLKDLARKHETAILAIAPLVFSPRGRPDPRPQVNDFGAAIADHADAILGLFREELYDRDPRIKGATELHLLKNRSGPSGSFADLFFFGEWLRFEDVMEPDR
ncbi:MAG TPA: DnaB-like helicase C-terminal domain-containing protein [Gemmatimonadaceae bacterium]|nr:DnaB-like helicase C-terminal domain-containing protein [Gemmatimonadaceae bacterium]